MLDFPRKKSAREPIVMLTAYDYPSARQVEAAGADIILVGDSLAMVVLGMESTVPLTLDESLHHCRAVARGSKTCFLLGDMPFLTYQVSVAEAVTHAGRYLKEGGMDAVKVEGGRRIAGTVRAMVDAGIPVMGHVGLTPQSAGQLGGYRVQGKTAASAVAMLEDALALEAAGCFSVVLESVPAAVAQRVSQRLQVPTIGIGAGAGCDGQVLVYHDLLGIFDDFQPRFVRRYGELGGAAVKALTAYAEDVRSGSFPAVEHTYPMDDDELQRFLQASDEVEL
ncbi:MAG: 3-methyl-2-oxobutanoate hydroxymethyltransferase [Acidobacteriota bacterium]